MLGQGSTGAVRFGLLADLDAYVAMKLLEILEGDTLEAANGRF